MKPSAPVMTNAGRQPQARAIAETTGVARAAPMAVPELKMPTASARSFIGNHSDTAFTPPGKLAGSVAPSKKRKNENCTTPRASACSMLAIDQPETNRVKPRAVPSRSISRPLTAYITV